MKIIKCLNKSQEEIYIFSDDIIAYVSNESGKTKIFCSHDLDEFFSINIDCQQLIKQIHGNDIEIISDDKDQNLKVESA